jgi:hypothetical protein
MYTKTAAARGFMATGRGSYIVTNACVAMGGRQRGYTRQTKKTSRPLMKHSTHMTKISILSQMVQRKEKQEKCESSQNI